MHYNPLTQILTIKPKSSRIFPYLHKRHGLLPDLVPSIYSTLYCLLCIWNFVLISFRNSKTDLGFQAKWRLDWYLQLKHIKQIKSSYGFENLFSIFVGLWTLQDELYYFRVTHCV